MSKCIKKEMSNLLFVFITLSGFLGIKETISVIKEIIKMYNKILTTYFDTTILNEMFSHCLTFPIVGIILVIIRSPKGKEGRVIGKILYFIIGYIIDIVLKYISNMIFI